MMIGLRGGNHMAEQEGKQEEKIEKVEPEYTLDVVYRFMVKHGEFISSQEIMDRCNISRTQFYNALDQLRKLSLVEVKVDMNDFRKKYYRAKPREDQVY